MRQLGSFLPGEGVGGAGVHWNGITWRFHEWDHEARRQTSSATAPRSFPTDMHLQDWGVTYAELEPTTTSSRRPPASRARPATSTGRRSRAATPSRGLAARVSQSAAVSSCELSCSTRPRAISATTPSRRPLQTLRKPTPTPTALPSATATIAASASASAARSMPRRSAHFTVIPMALRESELRAAHPHRGAEGQSRLDRQEGGQRHLSRRARPGVRAAGRPHRACRPTRSATST